MIPTLKGESLNNFFHLMDGRMLKRAWRWLRRIKYCRGFGVQSPTDYRFVRGVINEHAPYYLYEDLARELPGLDSLKR